MFKPLAAYEELASRAGPRQRRGDAAAAGAGLVRHADLNPAPNPRYYRVDPPQDLEERIRATNVNTLPGITIIGELCGHLNGTPHSAPPTHQNGVPPRIRTPGTPRPMVFGHRPVLRGPMPSQAAIFADDEDENDQNDSPVFGLQHARTHTPGESRPMDSGGSSSTVASSTSHQAQQASPRVRTPGTPRPMVFGTRPVFCGRMPSQAVTVESDHEDDDSDATIRGGVLIDYDSDFKGEHGQDIRGGYTSYADFNFDFEDKDKDKDEILVAVHEIAEPNGRHTDAHEVCSATSGKHVEGRNGAKSQFSSGISSGGGEGYDLEEGWVCVARPAISGSTNENAELPWMVRHIRSRRDSISDGMAREYQLFIDEVVSEAEEVASMYSADEPATAEEAFFLRWQPNKAVHSEWERKTECKKMWKLARSKVDYRDRKARRARRFVKMRRERKAREETTEIGHWDEDEGGLEEVEIFADDGALAVKAEEDYRPFFEHEEGMVRNLGLPTMRKPEQTCEGRTEQLRGGWLPITVEYDIESPANMTWEEELSIPFKHNKYADTKHWQCQSYISACTKCRAKPATQAIDSLPELTLEELDLLPRNHMWRFELHRAYQAIKEALIHTAVDEFLEAYEAEQNAFLDATEVEQKTSTAEDETGNRGGYLSGLGDDQDDDDHKGHTAISAQAESILQTFKTIGEAMMITAQLDFKAMLYCPAYPVRGATWEKFGDGHEMLKMRPLDRLWRAWEIVHGKSFEGMEKATMVTAVLDGRAGKLAEMERRLGEGLRGGALEGFYDIGMEEFGDEEVVVEHREYAASSRQSFGRHDTAHDSSSGHESGSEMSRVGSENSSETSQDTIAISSGLSKELPLTEDDRRELAADAWCLFTTGGFGANALMDETETRNRLHGIISSFRNASNDLPDGTNFPEPVAVERLWNTRSAGVELGWTSEDVREFGGECKDWGLRELGIMAELKKVGGFATRTSHQGFPRPNTGLKTKRKVDGIEVCEHGLKVPRLRSWDSDTPLPYRFVTCPSGVWTDGICHSIEQAAELERMVVLHQILDLQPRGEGPEGWPMVGCEAPRIVSCMGPKSCLFLKDKDLKPKGPMRKGKAARYPQTLRDWLVFVEENDGDAMSALSDDEDYIEPPNTAIQRTITVAWYKDGGVEVETQGLSFVDAARPGLCPGVARRKMKAIRWPQGLRSWQRYTDEEVSSLRGGDYAMVMQASITLPAVSCDVGMKSTGKISSATKGFPRQTSLRKEVIGFPSGTHPRLSWLGNWGFVIPAWQPRFRRSGKERLRRLSEARRFLRPTLWDEFPHRSQDAITQLPLSFSIDTKLRGDGIIPSPQSFRTSTSLRDEGITQLPPEEDLPYPEFPWEPLNFATATSSTPLRGGGNALSEVSEAAQDVAYALARPREFYELVMQPDGFKAYAGDRISGPKEIGAIQKHNRRARASASVSRESRCLRRNACRWPTPTHHDPGFVYKWKDVAWDRPNAIFVPFDRRNRYSRGVSRADMWGGKYFWDGTKMRYAQGNCRKPSQKVVRRSGWTRGARRRGGIFGEELVGGLSGLRGVEFARSALCGGDAGLPSGASGSLRGGQLSNEEEKDQMEGLECHEAQTTDDQESQAKALESHNDAREYQIQCSGQDAATTSPSNETTKLTSNAFSHPPTSSPLSFLNQAFVPSPSSSVGSLYIASLRRRKRTGLGKTMTWLALNNHHKKCRPGVCANPCRAIVTLPFKPPQTMLVSRLESINAIGHWFGEEAEALCKPSSGALRGGFLKEENEERREDGEEIDWRSANSMRDGEPDPVAHFLMTVQSFSHRRIGRTMEEIHADLSGHNYDCHPGQCSLFCRASGPLLAPEAKTGPHENFDALLAYVKNMTPRQDDPAHSACVSKLHPYSQRIAELNRSLGLAVRTDFGDGCCMEGHTHPLGMGVFTESDQSRMSFQRLKGKRPEQARTRSMLPLLSPLPIRQKPHWWVSEVPRQFTKEEMRPPTASETGSLRGGDLDEAFKMPRSGVNGWLFDRSTNWTFRRAISKENQSETQGTDTDFRAGYRELQLPDSPPLTPVVGHVAEKLVRVFEKMSFVPSLKPSQPQPRNASVSSGSGPVSLGYAHNSKFDPYLCWPEWAYKLYDPPHNPYDSPACDTTGRWRRPVSRHLLAGMLETLPEKTGMFRRLEDGTIIRIGLQEMTAEERETMLKYAKEKKSLRRNSWELNPCLEARLLVEEAGELKWAKKGLRGGALEYPPSGPLAVHFDGDIRWSFRCCGCRPMTPDSPVLEAITSEATAVFRGSSEDSQNTSNAADIDPKLLSPSHSPITEQRCHWYSRPVDANSLTNKLRALLPSKSDRFKDKHGNMVRIDFKYDSTQSPQSRRLKPSEVLTSKIDSHKTRALKPKTARRTGTWPSRRGGLRGGGLEDDEEMEMNVDYPSPPTSDNEDEDEGYISIALSSLPDSDSEEESGEAGEDPEDDVLDEQEMDYELSVDLLPLEDAYTKLRESLREEYKDAMEMVDQSRRDFEKKGLQPARRAKLRLTGHTSRATLFAPVGDDGESDFEEECDYDPDLENVAPIVYEHDTYELPSPVTRIYDADVEDFPPLPSSNKTDHFSPAVSTRASSTSSADFPSKGMWVMVHPRVTQLLVAGTCRYKSKHLEKNSGLMRLHDEWVGGTPSSMRLMTSVSAFREEIGRERAWERRERDRLDSIEKLQVILADLDRSVVGADAEDTGSAKDGVKVLDVEVASDSEDDTHTIPLTDEPDKVKGKKDSDAPIPILETVWTSPHIQFADLRRPQDHIAPGESERSLEKKAKRLMANDEDVRQEGMVVVMELAQAQASSTTSIEGGLRGGLGFVVDDVSETLSDLSGPTKVGGEEEGEDEERGEEIGEDIMVMTREVEKEKDLRGKERWMKRLARMRHITHHLAGIEAVKAEGTEDRRKSRYQERRESIRRGFRKDEREGMRTEDMKCEISHIASKMVRGRRMW